MSGPQTSKRKRGTSPRERSALETAAAAESHSGVILQMREWLDALIIAFVLAMFIRTFVVELFKIPSGSMSPTLLGDYVAEGVALDENSREQSYLFIRDRHSDVVQVFRKDSTGHFVQDGPNRLIFTLTVSQQDLIRRDTHLEEHRIFVNKFAYWFQKPDRGDIIVFRVPFKMQPTIYERNNHKFQVRPYDRNEGVYVKRAVALDGEKVEIGPTGRLTINGKEVTTPPIFNVLRYSTTPETEMYKITVPPDHLIAFGDNTNNSLDSRYWGGVPYENLRGKAFFRYWPVRKMRFLNN
jgi:signal peptidase I